jgi:hypothetical protein
MGLGKIKMILTRWIGAKGDVARSVRRLEVVEPSAEQRAEIQRNNHLAKFAGVIESQAGEEGVIDEIMRILGIKAGWCVEFGAYDGRTHSNTWNLIKNRGWKSVQIEPLDTAFESLQDVYREHPDVYCIHGIIEPTGERSLDAILASTPIPTDFDFMVVDIDGDDIHVWRHCKAYWPKVVMIEFNPFIAADVYFEKPIEHHTWAAASLRAVCELAKTKGYELICVVGGNAIFVQQNYFELFSIPDNRPEAMFLPWGETKIFQSYDGTLLLAGFQKFVWKYQIGTDGKKDHVPFTDDDVQALPKGLRVFRPRLSYRNPFLDTHTLSLDPARVSANALLAHRKNVTSECGEDGILSEMFQRLGLKAGFCVDVGANDGRAFSSTWNLLNTAQWRGLLIEKDLDAHSKAATGYADNKRVTLLHAEATTAGPTSLEALLRGRGVPTDFEYLCIDVEGNDYHLWKSLRAFVPKVVQVAFNPTISNDILFIQQDDLAVHEGASLRAFTALANDKEYELAAVTSWNALFVRRDLFPKLGLAPSANAIEKMYYPVFETKIIQSMDSTLSIIGCDRLIFHDYKIDAEVLQPLPPDLRKPASDASTFGNIPSIFFRPVIGGDSIAIANPERDRQS